MGAILFTASEATIMPQTIPSAEPFFFPRGPTACLLIHGFTGAPKEMRWMGEYLANQGYTVLGIRLAGHATQPADLIRTRWQDWLTSVEDGYNLLRSDYTRLFVCGLSMGGILSLLFAARFPVNGVIAMSTPYDLNDWRQRYLKLIHWFIPRVAKGPPDWRNPEAARDHVDYPAYPTRAILEVRYLLAEMRRALPQVNVPVLLVHSRQDSGVLPENMQQIYNHLGTSDKQMLWVENSGHVITREPERQLVFEAAHSFIQRVTQDSGITR
jgi:carboxylesterase